jgi:scyllo-inositol 2-dehydrogenase (NADP+)
VSEERPPGNDAERVIRVGLAGYGMAGATFHAPVIAAVPQLRITKVMTSRSDDVARDLPGAVAVSTADALVEDPAIDLVVIVTPNPSHAELADRALRAGKHVVIDKPMTVSVAEANALIALAAQTGRVLSVYQNRRWDNDFLTVRKLIESSRLGHVYAYEAHYDRFRPEIKAGWRERAQPGSGLLFDLGSHLIDQALTLFGLPETVAADVLMQRPHARVDDYFHVVLGYGDRRAIVHASTIVREPGPHFAVHGDGGSFVKYGMDSQEAALKAGARAGTAGWGADDPAAYGTFVDAAETRETIPTIPGNYAAYYAGIATAIARGGPVPVTAESARDVIAIIEIARRSAAERRTISL